MHLRGTGAKWVATGRGHSRGVDAERFTPARRSDELRRRWSPDGRPVVGFVGRLAPEKHVDFVSYVLQWSAAMHHHHECVPRAPRAARD